MKLRDRFSVYESASIRYGITIEVRHGDWIYLDIYFGTKYLLVHLKNLRKEVKDER